MEQNQLKKPSLNRADKLSSALSDNAEKIGNFAVSFIKKHWLAILNLLFFAYVFGATLSPILIYLGYPKTGKLLFYSYYFFCHQNPSHSFIILGQPTAICARCVSIYSSIFFFGLLFGLFFKLKKTIRINLTLGIILSLPLILDLLTQFLGLRESNNLLRTATGILFGGTIVFYLYPQVKFLKKSD